VVALVLLSVELCRAGRGALGDVNGVVGGGAGDEVVFARGDVDEGDVRVGESGEGLELLASPESNSGSVSRDEVGSERRPGEVVVSPVLRNQTMSRR
jgi:hypothetical protein